MARAGSVVQVERLRDQVYRLIREDLKIGALIPGQRIVEGELAERYSVSRTPVREALFQLARDGLLATGTERGYVVAVDYPLSTAYRHEVRDLLDPRLAFHAANQGKPEQRKALLKTHERQQVAHDDGELALFLAANIEFRTLLRDMCANQLLAKCSALIDDQAQTARRSAFTEAGHRQTEIDSNAKIVAAVVSGDAAGAEAAMRAYVETVRQRLPEIVHD